MIKYRLYFVLGLLVTALSSCFSDRQINQYGPAYFRNDIAYQPKPIASDSSHHATYISGAYVSGTGSNYDNSSDNIIAGELNIGQGYTFSNFSLAYGAFGSIGSYTNNSNNDQTQANYFHSKSFAELGGRFSANAFITAGRVDIRFIGIEAAYSHEFGDYAQYRRDVTGQTDIYTNTRTQLFTLGGTSEVVIHLRNNGMRFGFRLFIGNSFGDNSYKNLNNTVGNQYYYYPSNTAVSLAYFMQVKQFVFVAETNGSGFQLRTGFAF